LLAEKKTPMKTIRSVATVINNSYSAVKAAAEYFVIRQQHHCITGVDGICGSGQNGTVKNRGVENAGVD